MNLDNWQIEKEQEVQELKDLVEAGEITQGEFEELVEDLLDLAGISENLELEDNKIKAQKSIDAIRVVAGLL